MKKTVKIEGMSCGHCTARVQNALEELGMKTDVSLENGAATIEAEAIDDTAVCAAIDEAGYEVTGIDEV